MLKSTYKPSAGLAPLAEGWTQHKAPDGRPYYYHATSKKSTYTRPSEPPQPVTRLNPVGALDHSFGADNANVSTAAVGSYVQSGPDNNFNHYHRSGSDRRAFDAEQRSQPKDRPKKKFLIPGCSPWLLVQTKLGRRFVHNPDTGESLWRFPLEVMKCVIEFDRQEREKRSVPSKGVDGDDEDEVQAAAEAELATAGDRAPTASAAPLTDHSEPVDRLVDSDGEEYEEVEVTDEEDDDHLSKRQRTDEEHADQPVEFNEDDIAYQLAAMGEDYGLEPGEFGNGDNEELEEGAEGLELGEEDAMALFKDMLSDFRINPYTTWDKIIEAGHIIEDDRYTVLPNMRSRKEVWDEWSRDAIQRLKDQREKEEKKDPRIPYFAFLESHATPKLYWPEFRRKYRKETEMHSTKISDKDREKWYREYINRLKLPESTLKTDLIKLLKSTPLHTMNQSTIINSLPPSILTDLRYISLRKTVRDALIEGHISTLPPAPAEPAFDEVDLQAKSERERRERALAERQAQVQEEKRRQRGALQYSKGMLREGEEELQKAMKVGKEGLLGHMIEEQSSSK
ncbi:hypothetical protein ACLMJK_007832 [Lecanora helva]